MKRKIILFCYMFLLLNNITFSQDAKSNNNLKRVYLIDTVIVHDACLVTIKKQKGLQDGSIIRVNYVFISTEDIANKIINGEIPINQDIVKYVFLTPDEPFYFYYHNISSGEEFISRSSKLYEDNYLFESDSLRVRKFLKDKIDFYVFIVDKQIAKGAYDGFLNNLHFDYYLMYKIKIPNKLQNKP